jgi:hypothetical protein
MLEVMDKARHQQWISGMMNVQGVEMWMYEIVRGLARLDAKLFEEDKWVANLPDWNDRTLEDRDRLDDHLTISAFWVMGAYEFARTFRQRLKENKHYQQAVFNGLVEKFERVRIPLAKLETPRKAPELSRIARAGILVGYGVGWKVADQQFVTRRELADGLIHAISEYHHYGDPAKFAGIFGKHRTSAETKTDAEEEN